MGYITIIFIKIWITIWLRKNDMYTKDIAIFSWNDHGMILVIYCLWVSTNGFYGGSQWLLRASPPFPSDSMNPKTERALFLKGRFLKKMHHQTIPNHQPKPLQTTNSWLLIALFMEKPMLKRDFPILIEKTISGWINGLLGKMHPLKPILLTFQ